MTDPAIPTDETPDREPIPGPAAPDRDFLGMSRDRVELLATIVLAAAVILTAWSAFQSTKWSGVMSINFSEAGAARTESTRFSTRAGQLTQIDVALYVDWVSAVHDELDRGLPVIDAEGGYVPVEGTLSRFVFIRMRDEFRPALDAWLATDPVDNPDAPPSPFEMEEYVLADRLESDRLQALAEEKAAAARDANQTGDTYVLTAVLFATVLFFSGISSKLERRRNRHLTLSIGVVILVLATVLVFSLPIELGNEFFFLGD